MYAGDCESKLGLNGVAQGRDGRESCFWILAVQEIDESGLHAELRSHMRALKSIFHHLRTCWSMWVPITAKLA